MVVELEEMVITGEIKQVIKIGCIRTAKVERVDGIFNQPNRGSANRLRTRKMCKLMVLAYSVNNITMVGLMHL